MKNIKDTVTTIVAGLIVYIFITFTGFMAASIFAIVAIIGMIIGALIGKKLTADSRLYKIILWLNAVSWIIAVLGIFVASITIGLTFYNKNLNSNKLNALLVVNFVLVTLGTILPHYFSFFS